MHKGEDERDMAGDLGARSEGYEEVKRDLENADGSEPTMDDTDRGDVPAESSDSPGASQSPGG